MVAFALMFVGISLLGVVTATIAPWFIARTTEAAEEQTSEVDARLTAIEAQLAEIRNLPRDNSDRT
jgi:voltage-gated potassium channel